MQIFEVVEIQGFPYMETREVAQGQVVGDILNETSLSRVYLLVDHDLKRIWAYNGPKSFFKVQIYGGILAGMFRRQLRGFYRIYPLNMYTKEDHELQELLEKPIGGGRAKPIEKKDFPEPTPDKYAENITITNPKIYKALEYIEQFPQPQHDELIRRFMIISGTIYTDEEITETFLKEEKSSLKPIKLGRLNNGFTFFQDHNYSTRLIIKERKVQGIELFIHKDDKSPAFKIDIPVIHEDKFSKPGSMKSLSQAFKIPKQMNIPDEEEEEKEDEEEEDKAQDTQNDSTD